MRGWMTGAAMAAAAALAAGRAEASIEGPSATAFTAVETAHIAAAPDRVFAVLIEPARWWSSDHSYSGDAANFHLDARAGGCWCETLPNGGSAEHLRVVNVVPGKMLRLTGALGPLQTMPVQGVLTVSLTPAGGGTDVKLTYALIGPAGLGDLAGPVDNVLGQEVARLKATAESAR